MQIEAAATHRFYAKNTSPARCTKYFPAIKNKKITQRAAKMSTTCMQIHPQPPLLATTGPSAALGEHFGLVLAMPWDCHLAAGAAVLYPQLLPHPGHRKYLKHRELLPRSHFVHARSQPPAFKASWLLCPGHKSGCLPLEPRHGFSRSRK